jgi:hypothetical protein
MRDAWLSINRRDRPKNVYYIPFSLKLDQISRDMKHKRISQNVG